jgi:opacity protein-like surface antigen
MKRLAFLATAVILLAVTQSAVADESKFKIYGMLAYVAPLSETDQDVGGVTDAVKASSEFGYNVGVEFRAGSLLGLEFDYLYAKHDVEAETAGLLGETTFQPISGTLNLHVPVGNLDLYAGPTAAYVNWGDLEVPSGGADIAIDPEFAIGLSAGVDVAILPNLAATGGLRWLNVKAEPEDGGDALDVNPLFARFGVALKF